jgi:hypothetical protein
MLITTAPNGARRIQVQLREQDVFLDRDQANLHLVYNSRTPNRHDKRKDILSLLIVLEKACSRENGKRRLRGRAVV